MSRSPPKVKSGAPSLHRTRVTVFHDFSFFVSPPPPPSAVPPRFRQPHGFNLRSNLSVNSSLFSIITGRKGHNHKPHCPHLSRPPNPRPNPRPGPYSSKRTTFLFTLLFEAEAEPNRPPKMITRFITQVTTKFNPFSPQSKPARLFLSFLPPNARSSGMNITTQLLPRHSAEKPTLYVKFSA